MKIEKNKLHILGGLTARDDARNVSMFDYYIGIDPDVIASGYAVWDKTAKKLTGVTTMAFFQLYKEFEQWAEFSNNLNRGIYIHVEGGWLNEKSNWHFDKQSKSAGERIAKNVGANHQVGKLIVEMCIHLDLSFKVRQPIRPTFADDAIFKKITGWTGKTNADARSAANYVYGF